MNTAIVKAWEAGKTDLRAKWTAKMPKDYESLVRDVVATLEQRMEEHDRPDTNRITVIDHGDYQGTLVFVVGSCGYQPVTYYVVKIDYGSCGQCDSFQAALDGNDPIGDFMTMALHVVQEMKEI